MSDDVDRCPRVYSRSEYGCPQLAATVDSTPKNLCYSTYLARGSMIFLLSPICHDQSCPRVSEVVGIQKCDPIFPLILTNDGNPYVRGGIFIFGFS